MSPRLGNISTAEFSSPVELNRRKQWAESGLGGAVPQSRTESTRNTMCLHHQETKHQLFPPKNSLSLHASAARYCIFTLTDCTAQSKTKRCIRADAKTGKLELATSILDCLFAAEQRKMLQTLPALVQLGFSSAPLRHCDWQAVTSWCMCLNIWLQQSRCKARGHKKTIQEERNIVNVNCYYAVCCY